MRAPGLECLVAGLSAQRLPARLICVNAPQRRSEQDDFVESGVVALGATPERQFAAFNSVPGDMMHTFKVVKEPNGWAVKLDRVMTTPFRSKALAVAEAHCLADALRRHGAAAEVVIDSYEPDDVQVVVRPRGPVRPILPNSGLAGRWPWPR